MVDPAVQRATTPHGSQQPRSVEFVNLSAFAPADLPVGLVWRWRLRRIDQVYSQLSGVRLSM